MPNAVQAINSDSIVNLSQVSNESNLNPEENPLWERAQSSHFKETPRAVSGQSGISNIADGAENIKNAGDDKQDVAQPQAVSEAVTAEAKTTDEQEANQEPAKFSRKESTERAEADRQYDTVVSKYKGTALWMKAPNGKPTKLTERQWVQVRTENFKKWFGDWEKAGIRERLESQKPIPVKARFTEETAKLKKSEAVKLLPEPFSETKIIGEVFVTNGTIRDSVAHSRNAAKLDVIPHLREVLKQAEYLGALDDFTGEDIRNHYFATRISHNGETKLVFLRVRELGGRENKLYVHDVFVEEDIKAGSPSQTREYSKEAISRLRSTDLYKTILQDIYAADNSQVSKVVDENGEPRIDAKNIRYQRGESQDTSLAFEEVQQIADELAAKFDNAPELVVVEKPTDIEPNAPEDGLGAYRNGRIFLVRATLSTAPGARNAFIREVIGHYGFNGFFGDRLNVELDSIVRHNPNVRKEAEKWIKFNTDRIKFVR